MPLDHVALRFSQNTDVDEIASVYSGIRYDSRRHAQWAVFFDTLGLEHDHHPRSLQLGRGVSFTPDFWLPEMNAWLVVKPADASIQEADRWKAELFADRHPEVRVWLSNGVPRAGGWYLEQIGAVPVRRGMLLADASEPSRRVWVCGASDEQATRLLFDAIDIGTGRPAPTRRTYPADPNTNSLMRLAYGRVEHFQADGWASLGAVVSKLDRGPSSGVLPM
jgi:hypothetical protein